MPPRGGALAQLGLRLAYQQLQHGEQQLAPLLASRLARSSLQPLATLHARRGYSGPGSLEEARKALVSNHLLVDTLDLTKTFEKTGLPRDTAEQLARDISAVILLNKQKMDEAFVKQSMMEKIILEQEARIQGFKNELSKTQDMLQASVNKDLERQQSYLDKMKAEIRHEMDKLSASQRLDMNLEKGRMRDDLQGIRDKTTELVIKVDRDVNEVRSGVEKAKNDTIKSVITILGTFSAIAFTISRFVQMSTGG